MKKVISFDQVFVSWLASEVENIEGRDILAVAVEKGFSSIAEWRLNTCIRMGLDKKVWHLEELSDPNIVIPSVKIGPYKGWSKFFNNLLNTSFAEALKIEGFFEWARQHERIQGIMKNFPLETTLVVLRKPNGDLLHIEGGHRMCAVALAKELGEPVNFTNRKVFLASSDMSEKETPKYKTFLNDGTNKLLCSYG